MPSYCKHHLKVPPESFSNYLICAIAHKGWTNTDETLHSYSTQPDDVHGRG